MHKPFVAFNLGDGSGTRLIVAISKIDGIVIPRRGNAILCVKGEPHIEIIATDSDFAAIWDLVNVET